MKILLACSADYMAVPAALTLKDAKMLAGVVVPGKFKSRLIPSFLQSGFEEGSLYTTDKATLETDFIELIKKCGADCVFVITFPWKIPDKAIAAATYGFINFHPGMLPKYRGADPIFWQLRNREQVGGFTAHRMTGIVDEGPVLMVQQVPIIPGETYGIHNMRLGMVVAHMVLPVVEKLAVETTTGNEINESPAFFRKPGKNDVTINWKQQGAVEIEALVNAANPKYNGAYTHIRGVEMSILEVAFANMENVPANLEPGTIVYADTLYGLIVYCADGNFIKINTVCMTEGYISGSKMFGIGFTQGDKFY